VTKTGPQKQHFEKSNKLFVKSEANCIKMYNITINSSPNFNRKCCSIQGVLAKTFEPNNWVIFQRIFVKFKMQIF
jgi:hypothetical protein